MYALVHVGRKPFEDPIANDEQQQESPHSIVETTKHKKKGKGRKSSSKHAVVEVADEMRDIPTVVSFAVDYLECSTPGIEIKRFYLAKSNDTNVTVCIRTSSTIY